MSLSFSSDGKHLACNGDRTIHIWDATTGQALLGSGPRPATKTSVAISPDGKRLLTNGGGKAVRIWDTHSRTPVLTLESPAAVHAVAYSPDGRLIAGAAGRTIRIWDATGKVIGDWEGSEEPTTSLAFSSDGSLLASGSATGYPVWLWRTQDGEPVLLIPDPLDGCAVESLSFHPDGQNLAVGGVDYLATGGSSGAIAVWNIPGRYESILLPGGTTAIAFHPSGQQLASTTLDGTVCIWGMADQQLLTELTGHEGTITCLAYSPDGKWLATGSEDSTLRLWSARGEEYGVLEMESQLTGIVFSPDGRTLYTAHANTTCTQIRLTDLTRR
jgi:WD40 repeat protein